MALLSLHLYSFIQLFITWERGLYLYKTLSTTVAYKEAVQVLLDSGADVNSKNTEGYTALCLASLAGHAGACEDTGQSSKNRDK